MRKKSHDKTSKNSRRYFIFSVSFYSFPAEFLLKTDMIMKKRGVADKIVSVKIPLSHIQNLVCLQRKFPLRMLKNVIYCLLLVDDVLVVVA